MRIERRRRNGGGNTLLRLNKHNKNEKGLTVVRVKGSNPEIISKSTVRRR